MPLITTRDVARELAIGESTVADMCRRGMPHYRVGRLLRFELDEVLQWCRQTGGASNEKRSASHGSDQARRPVARPVQVPVPDDRFPTTIPAVDW